MEQKHAVPLAFAERGPCVSDARTLKRIRFSPSSGRKRSWFDRRCAGWPPATAQKACCRSVWPSGRVIAVIDTCNLDPAGDIRLHHVCLRNPKARRKSRKMCQKSLSSGATVPSIDDARYAWSVGSRRDPIAFYLHGI